MASRNAKGRMIYWKISYSKQLAKCSILARLLFTWMIPSADDLGRIEGEPDILKSMIFPRDKKITDKQIAEALKQLDVEKLIFWYEVDGTMYVQIPNFTEYQKLRQDRVHISDYPSPSDQDMTSHDKVCGREGKRREEEEEEGIEEEKENAPCVADGYFIDSAVNNTFVNFIKMRKQTKFPMTDEAIRLSIINLNKNFDTDIMRIEAIEKSIINGWRDIYPLKDAKDKAPPSKSGNKSAATIILEMNERGEFDEH